MSTIRVPIVLELAKQAAEHGFKLIDVSITTGGAPTSSGTAGLMAGGDTRSSSVLDGIAYLVETQNPDGTWSEELATGTGFPKVFYLNYHLYKLNFPLLALAAYQKSKS